MQLFPFCVNNIVLLVLRISVLLEYYPRRDADRAARRGEVARFVIRHIHAINTLQQLHNKTKIYVIRVSQIKTRWIQSLFCGRRPPTRP